MASISAGKSEEMDRHNCLGPRSDSRFQALWIQIVCFGIDVDEDWSSLQPRDASRGGNEGEWRGNDFITGINFQCHEGEQ